MKEIGRTRQYQLAHEAAGLCQACDKPVVEGLRRCQKHRKALNARSREKTKKRKAAGMCVQCGSRRIEAPSVSRCAVCLKYMRDHQRNRT